MPHRAAARASSSASTTTNASRSYYTALLVNVGCHTDAHEQAYWFGDDIAMKATKYDHEPFSVGDVAAMVRLLGSGGTPLHRVRVAFDFAISGRKEVDGMIAQPRAAGRGRWPSELGLPDAVLDAVGASYERWDGKGWPGAARRARRSRSASRIAQLAEFVEVAHRTGGIEAAHAPSPSAARGSSSTRGSSALLVADAEKVFHGLDDLELLGRRDRQRTGARRRALARRSATRRSRRSPASST